MGDEAGAEVPGLRARLRRHGLSPRPRGLPRLPRTALPAFREGNRLRFSHDGRGGLAAMLAAIRGARRSVHLETYILRPDATGRRFVEALTERAKRGVEVRVLYDAFGSLGLGSLLAPLEAAGGITLAFNPLGRFYPRWAPRRRDHRKVLVVDGHVAFTGGLNIGDEYDGPDADTAAGEPGWRDTHVRLEGPAVRDLAAVFLESWFRGDGPDVDWGAALGPGYPEAGTTRCAVLPDGPSYRRRRMRELLLAELDAARRHVRLTTPYFAPGRRVYASLERAAARGCRVQLVIAGKTDVPLLRRAARHTVGRLLARGVEVHEYDAAILHAKVASFDGERAVIGTSNLDRQSFEHSFEVNLRIEDPDCVNALDARFERDLSLSRRLDEASLARRSPSARLADRVAAILVRLA